QSGLSVPMTTRHATKTADERGREDLLLSVPPPRRCGCQRASERAASSKGGKVMSRLTRDSDGCLQLEFASERLCGLTAAELEALGGSEQEAVVNALVVRVGLIALVGEEEAERLWREREEVLVQLVAEQLSVAAAPGFHWVRIKPPFDLECWTIKGHKVRF